eukprot:NODE_279_length_10886_cov_0.340039.p7 type:complete len:200 gc:universal NODE_279_length_10886_cov_0.340039:5274-4675(-)
MFIVIVFGFGPNVPINHVNLLDLMNSSQEFGTLVNQEHKIVFPNNDAHRKAKTSEPPSPWRQNLFGLDLTNSFNFKHMIIRNNPVNLAHFLKYYKEQSDGITELDVEDKNGNTPLDVAIKNNLVAVAVVLVQYGFKNIQMKPISDDYSFNQFVQLMIKRKQEYDSRKWLFKGIHYSQVRLHQNRNLFEYYKIHVMKQVT